MINNTSNIFLNIIEILPNARIYHSKLKVDKYLEKEYSFQGKKYRKNIKSWVCRASSKSNYNSDQSKKDIGSNLLLLTQVNTQTRSPIDEDNFDNEKFRKRKNI